MKGGIQTLSKFDRMAKRLDKLVEKNKKLIKENKIMEELYFKDKMQTNIKWQKFIQIYVVSLVALRYDYSNYEIELKDGTADLKLSRSE